MLTILVSAVESFDDSSQEFVVEGGTPLELEHSLVSLSKWESEHEKPFLGREPKTGEEVLAYVRAMAIDPNVPAEIFAQLDEENFKQINAYIESKQSATWFNEAPGAPQSSEVITSELIYYWLTVFNIPFEAERWNLNRLFNLIRICNIKSAKPKKMSRAETVARQRELNAQRKAQTGTSG